MLNKKSFVIKFIPFLSILCIAFPTYAEQQTFATPEQAVNTLIQANRNDNKTEILKILGPDAKKLLYSGDPVADQEGRKKFLIAFDVAHQLVKENNSKVILTVGKNQWPLPIPLVQENHKWRFDTAAGAQKILDRRIGRNELNVIKVCHAYVAAQQEFANFTFQKNKVREYAQYFSSHSGKQDGLYWPATNGQTESPLGPLIADAQKRPYHGYFYKILKSQSQNATGGKMNYLTKGKMTKGFALIAYPAKFADSGIMTFIVNQDDKVFQKNLGPKTLEIASQINTYDPDKSWTPN